MSTTPKIDLPLLASGQAQKHVTLNEALLRLDGLVQATVPIGPMDTPPSEPSDGSCWLVGAEATGVWTSQDGKLAAFLDGGWRFYAPRAGWSVRRSDDNTVLVFDGAAWGPPPYPDALQNLERLGVGATADAGNPLSANLNNVLLSARPVDGGGDGHIRLKLSKEVAPGSASLIYQSGFSGRAEIGLLGDDDLSIKVSSDGASWVTGLTINRADGAPSLPANPKFRASLGSDAYCPADAWTKVPFDVASYDPLLDFDTTNRRYVTPVAGFYVFGAQVGMVSDGSPPTGGYAAIFIDGAVAEEARMRGTTFTSDYGFAVLTLARYLPAGTTVDVRAVFVAQDANFTGDGCQFWGFRVP